MKRDIPLFIVAALAASAVVKLYLPEYPFATSGWYTVTGGISCFLRLLLLVPEFLLFRDRKVAKTSQPPEPAVPAPAPVSS